MLYIVEVLSEVNSEKESVQCTRKKKIHECCRNLGALGDSIVKHSALPSSEQRIGMAYVASI